MANLNYGELINVKEEVYLPFRSKKYKCKNTLQLILIVCMSLLPGLFVLLVVNRLIGISTAVPLAILVGFVGYIVLGNVLCKVDEETEQSVFNKWYIIKFKKLNYVLNKDNVSIPLNNKSYKGNICYLKGRR